ncbi:TetR/AcrR family transcriptional regulator [Croceicoccus estronivorus]|uniref:TetR/AcrR family transcriptional regulator n=1 Tax=Croceicoccus estronivorus TaxID=1172626 RepID=UPI0014781E7E|nr:TetR/AcrR family transcriptional regulator [Croceicoccus estronivorus]
MAGPEILDEPRRMRVIHHATRIFIERSFEAATVEEIALAAGVGKASVYRMTGDKAGLLDAVMAHAADHMISACGVALDPARPAREMLTQFAQSYIQAMYRPFAGGLPFYQVARLMIAAGFERPEVMRDFIAAYRDSGVRPLTAYLQARADAGELGTVDERDAVTFFQMVFYTDQALAYNETAPEPSEIAVMAQYRVDRFLNGCARRPDGD